MPFSRNPVTGNIESYTENGFFMGYVSTMGDFISQGFAEDGGPGSGNFGHKGRPGQVGGSGKGGSEASATKSQESPDDFDVWDFLNEKPSESELKSYAKAANKALENLSKSYHMKGIQKAAKESKGDYKKFVDSMTKPQREAIEAQYRETGTEEYFTDYVKRMQKMLSDMPPAPDLQNKVVEGKDITENYVYKGSRDGYKKASESIDTQIEDVLHQQGFDGVPKIVSKDEFDKIVNEHQNVPVLIRAYTAQNAEALQKYNDDLEKGFFYVDCGVGGAQYGQGMYCAGVYWDNSDDFIVRKWDDPELRQYFEDEFVFKDDKGDSYITKEVSPESGDDLYVDTLYMWIDDKTQEPRLIKRDLDSLIWEDVGKGGIIDDEKIEDMLGKGAILECRRVNTSIYENAREDKFKDGLREAGVEADHYLQTGIARIMDDYKPKPPEGKKLVADRSNDSYFYYDPKKSVSFSDKEPDKGSIVAVTYDNGERPKMYLVHEGYATPIDRYDMDGTVEFDDLKEKGFKWSKVEGRIEDFAPCGTVRKMTLDPSAKIITYDELRELQDGGILEKEYEKASLDYFEKMTRDLDVDKEYLEYMRDVYMERCGYRSYTESKRHVKLLYKLENDDYFPERTLKERAGELSGSLWNDVLFDLKRKSRDKVIQYQKFDDPGALAAALGYDAINAEGHGKTMSYTVVLNRSKVILQKEPM